MTALANCTALASNENILGVSRYAFLVNWSDKTIAASFSWGLLQLPYSPCLSFSMSSPKLVTMYCVRKTGVKTVKLGKY